MKKLIIATSILFAFSATFAQEGKPSKKTPMSSKAPTSVSANEAKPNKKPNVKPNVKPVGKTSTKPSPVVSKVSPVKPAKPIGPASNRAAQSSKGASSKPEAVTEKQKPSKVNARNFEKGEVNNFDEKKPTTPNKEISSNKPDADYCKGWKEGYMKAFSKATGEKISSSDVPNCISRGECEGYKCGYAAGVKNAERKIR